MARPLTDLETIRAIGAELKAEDEERGQPAFYVWLLGINCGLRVSDILRLKVAAVCTKGKRVKSEFTIREHKTRKNRLVTIGEDTRRELQQYINGLDWHGNKRFMSFLFESNRKPGRALSYVWFNNRLKEAAAALSLEDITSHTMRKTFARLWYDQNIAAFHGDIRQCAQTLQETILHHTSLSITMRYINIEEDYIRESTKGIDITT